MAISRSRRSAHQAAGARPSGLVAVVSSAIRRRASLGERGASPRARGLDRTHELGRFGVLVQHSGRAGTERREGVSSSWHAIRRIAATRDRDEIWWVAWTLSSPRNVASIRATSGWRRWTIATASSPLAASPRTVMLSVAQAAAGSRAYQALAVGQQHPDGRRSRRHLCGGPPGPDAAEHGGPCRVGCPPGARPRNDESPGLPGLS